MEIICNTINDLIVNNLIMLLKRTMYYIYMFTKSRISITILCHMIYVKVRQQNYDTNQRAQCLLMMTPYPLSTFSFGRMESKVLLTYILRCRDSETVGGRLFFLSIKLFFELYFITSFTSNKQRKRRYNV